MSKRGPLDIGLDEIVWEIDGLMEANEETAILQGEPRPSAADRKRAGAWWVLMDLVLLLTVFGAVGGYLFYTGRIHDLLQLLAQHLY